jgi:hypothetical protein
VGADSGATGIVIIDASGNPPAARALSKTRGATTGGNPITISGHDFDALASVQFDNVAATNVQVVNSTEITLTTPAHAEGTVDVIVTNSDGQTATLPHAFQYVKQSGGSGGGWFGCSMSPGAENGKFDPTFPLLLLIATIYLVRRRYGNVA